MTTTTVPTAWELLTDSLPAHITIEREVGPGHFILRDTRNSTLDHIWIPTDLSDEWDVDVALDRVESAVEEFDLLYGEAL